MHRPWQSVSVILSLWGTACLINGSFVNGVLVLWVQKPLSSHVINGVIRAVITKIYQNGVLKKLSKRTHGNKPKCKKDAREAVPWLRWLVADVSPRRPGFARESMYVGLGVDTVEVGQVLLWVIQFSPVCIIPPWLSILIYHLGVGGRSHKNKTRVMFDVLKAAGAHAVLPWLCSQHSSLSHTT
jgi:hypothetical protein